MYLSRYIVIQEQIEKRLHSLCKKILMKETFFASNIAVVNFHIYRRIKYYTTYRYIKWHTTSAPFWYETQNKLSQKLLLLSTERYCIYKTNFKTLPKKFEYYKSKTVEKAIISKMRVETQKHKTFDEKNYAQDTKKKCFTKQMYNLLFY